jgi:hypothetical protein
MDGYMGLSGYRDSGKKWQWYFGMIEKRLHSLAVAPRIRQRSVSERSGAKRWGGQACIGQRQRSRPVLL